MSRQLVFVHGRSQENKDPGALKAEWLAALGAGLARNGLTLPIEERDVRFPYYGDTLDGMVQGQSAEEAAKVIVRGDGISVEEQQLIQELLEEVRRANGITDEQLAEVAGADVLTKGVFDSEWSQAILRAIDRHLPFGSGVGVALSTWDVYRYLTDPGIRDTLESGVAESVDPGRETVVVGHSLGSVVAYRTLRTRGRRWKVPLFVTVGSPLGIERIRKGVRDGVGPARSPECATRWHNAMDERDVVALYPLTPEHFPLNPTHPSIDNRTDLQNHTSNRHGIAGYLDDPELAMTIYSALVA